MAGVTSRLRLRGVDSHGRSRSCETVETARSLRAGLAAPPPHLAAHVDGQLLCNALRAREQRAARLRGQQQLVDRGAAAVDEVRVGARHAAVVQQPQQLLDDDADLHTGDTARGGRGRARRRAAS